MTLSPLRRLIIPVLLLVGAFLFRDMALGISPVYLKILDMLPYFTIGSGLALSTFYNQSRLFTASLGLLVVYHLILTGLQVSLIDPYALITYSFISVMIPLLMILLLFLPERGLRNRYGIMMIMLVPFPAGCAALLAKFIPTSNLIDWITIYLPVKPYAGYILSINSSAMFIIVVLLGVWQLLKKDSEHLSALIASLLFTFITLALFDQSKISALMFSIAGINLVISMVRSSYDMAYRDELTGLPGRRALNEHLKGLGRSYVLAMMDVDHFKKFNDTYGHDTGDEVLKMVAGRIAAVKGGGRAYRFGGEEFCIVFSGMNTDEAEPFLESVRSAVEGYRMTVRDTEHRKVPGKIARERRGRRTRGRGSKTVSVTISIGASQPDKNRNHVEKVLKAADNALYQAKKNGRNCLAVHR